MTPEIERRWLELGLQFCGSPARRQVIQAQINELLRDTPEERSGTAREAPCTGMRDGTATAAVQTPPETSVGVQPAAPHQKAGDSTPIAGTNTVAGRSDDWRGRRRALRNAGHEIRQFDGIVYVDGIASHDPGLSP